MDNNYKLNDMLNNNFIKSKYKRYAKILKQVSTDKLYKGDEIKDNEKLEKQRKNDIERLKKIISDELKNDGMNSIFIDGVLLSVID